MFLPEFFEKYGFFLPPLFTQLKLHTLGQAFWLGGMSIKSQNTFYASILLIKQESSRHSEVFFYLHEKGYAFDATLLYFVSKIVLTYCEKKCSKVISF